MFFRVFSRRFVPLWAWLLSSMVIGLTALPAQAITRQKFTPEAFEAAKKSGGAIVIDVHAPWCPTCKTQDGIINKLAKDPKYSKILMLDVDFDTQKDVVRALKATTQSTLIAFKGSQEITRSAGDTNPLSIEDLIEAALTGKKAP